MQEVSGSIPLGSTMGKISLFERYAGRRGFVRRHFSLEGFGSTLVGEVSPTGVFGVMVRPKVRPMARKGR